MKDAVSTRGQRVVLLLIVLSAAAGLVHGWRLFWFLTDDAYIAFRYVGNSVLGHGYVWNPPPFRPVEGYTSFLWVVLLDATWRGLAIEPPRSANVLSLLFSALTLVLGALMVLRMNLSAGLARYRQALLALVLLATLSNRTFLAWTSSGLETSLFNALVTLWIYGCLFLERWSGRWLLGLSASAALLYLARPDGLLFVATTAGFALATLRRRHREGGIRAQDWLALGPLLVVPLHLAFRLHLYGEWLPNTWFAKTAPGRMWAESGARYVLSFVLEHAIWIWIAALAAWMLRRLPGASFVAIAAVAPLIGQFLYYTLVVGGDHFEYRVYSHLILLLFVSFVWMLDTLRVRGSRALIALGLFVVASWPVPWAHWFATRDLATRDQTYRLKASTAEAVRRAIPFVPEGALGYFRLHDRLQSWLIDHFVCMRHQEHKVFHDHLVAQFATRDVALRAEGDDYPVIALSNVGVAGWMLPHVAIIDRFGLNDHVIARNGARRPSRFMAHDRRPPEGYVECFSPNVRLSGGRALIDKRDTPLTAGRIRACEDKYWPLARR